jgi:hypothetical protein
MGQKHLKFKKMKMCGVIFYSHKLCIANEKIISLSSYIYMMTNLINQAEKVLYKTDFHTFGGRP